MTKLHQISASFLRNQSGFTSIQAASTFAVAGVIGALVVTPLMKPNAPSLLATLPGAGIDMTATGSISTSGKKTTYRVRRSVLQKDSKQPCILFNSGRREGNC
ncbi:MAG: hypothetical protein AAFO70_00120 [Pseudomonadota bacterium]